MKKIDSTVRSNNPQQRVFDKFNNKAFGENSFLYIYFFEDSAVSVLPARQAPYFLILALASPSLFIPRNALSANPPRQRLFSFALVAGCDRRQPARKISPPSGVNRVCPPRLRRHSEADEGWPVFFFVRSSSRFLAVSPSFFLLLVLPQREMTIAAKYRDRRKAFAFY